MSLRKYFASYSIILLVSLFFLFFYSSLPLSVSLRFFHKSALTHCLRSCDALIDEHLCRAKPAFSVNFFVFFSLSFSLYLLLLLRLSVSLPLRHLIETNISCSIMHNDSNENNVLTFCINRFFLRHPLIQALRVPLALKYKCPSQSTWKLAVNSLITVLKTGLPVIIANGKNRRH